MSTFDLNNLARNANAERLALGTGKASGSIFPGMSIIVGPCALFCSGLIANVRNGSTTVRIVTLAPASRARSRLFSSATVESGEPSVGTRI
jgi:hypothetical protein